MFENGSAGWILNVRFFVFLENQLSPENTQNTKLR